MQREEPVGASGRTHGIRHQADVQFGGHRGEASAVRGTADADITAARPHGLNGWSLMARWSRIDPIGVGDALFIERLVYIGS